MRAIAVILYFIANVGVYTSLARHMPGDAWLVGRLIVVGSLSFVATLIHELGHALAAVRLGGQLRKIVVIPFEYRTRPRGFHFVARSPHADIGGYVSYSLNRINARRRRTLIALAGPAANLLLALVLHFGVRTSVEPGAIHDVIIALIILSSAMGLANLIPFAGSDGAQVFGALKRNRTQRIPAIVEP